MCGDGDIDLSYSECVINWTLVQADSVTVSTQGAQFLLYTLALVFIGIIRADEGYRHFLFCGAENFDTDDLNTQLETR